MSAYDLPFDASFRRRLAAGLLTVEEKRRLFTVAQDVADKLSPEQALRLAAELLIRIAVTPHDLGDDIDITVTHAAETLRRAVQRLDVRAQHQAQEARER